MIVTDISESSRYDSIHPLFKKAFDWIKRTDLPQLKEGKIELDGNKMYASVQKYNTKAVKDSAFEAHRKYIDIQLLVSGTEKVDYAAFSSLEEVEPYSAERDFHKLDGKAEQTVLLKKGNAVILFPEDGHRPCQHPDGKTATAVTKIVIKILL